MAKIYYDPEDPKTYNAFRVPDSSFHRDKYKLMMRSIPKKRKQKVLEVGAGTGIYTPFLVKSFDYVMATDLDKDMCAQIKRLAPKAKVKVADLCKLPFPKDSFDGVFGVSILHHVPDRIKAFKEVKRVLKPNGWFAFSEPNKLNPFTLMLQTYLREPALTKRTLVKEAKAAGLKVIECKTILLRSSRASSMTDKIPGWTGVEAVAGAMHLGVSVYIVGRKQ